MKKFITICTFMALLPISMVWAQQESVKTAPAIEIIEKRDIPYGPHTLNKLDIFTPKGAKNAPIILMVHGGAWKIGDKAGKNVVGAKLAKWGQEGFVFISMNYRLLPTHPYEQAQDVRRALAFVQKNGTKWGGDPERIIVMGHSAGAHLVGLATAKPSLAQTLGVKPWLGSVLLDSAALDVVSLMQAPHARFYDKAFGQTLYVWKKSSPYHQLTKRALPMLVVCSTKREGACDQANSFAKHAASLNVDVSVSEQDLSHRHVNKYLGLKGAYTDEVDNFMQDLLKTN